ncbi:hypothetical protein BS17DRAFT_786141 [Gyrodon lividus]|nr:hypothetical protein BS17DRAFT_786141 [Gyrodon lividus]
MCGVFISSLLSSMRCFLFWGCMLETVLISNWIPPREMRRTDDSFDWGLNKPIYYRAGTFCPQ